MKILLSCVLALTFLLAGCTVIQQMYGITPSAPAPLTAEQRTALIAQSAHDSTAVLINDSVYYMGAPAFRATVRSNSYADQVELATFSGMATATLYTEDPERDRSGLVVGFESPDKIVSPASHDGVMPVLTALLRNKVLTPGTYAFNAANLRKAIRSGLFRERPDLDSELAHQRAFVSRMPSGGSSSSGSSFSTSSGSSSSSAGESEQEKAQKRFMNSPGVRNTCSNNVRVFIGDSPGYGSGNNLVLSGNSIESGGLSGLHSGVKFWIIDDHEKPITGITVGDDTREIVIGSDGRSISQQR